MTLTQSILNCKTRKEVVALVDSQAKATLRGWKKKLLSVCLRYGPRESNQVKHNGHCQQYLVVMEGTIHLMVLNLNVLLMARK